MVLLAVNPFLDEFLGGVVIGEGDGHLVHHLYSLGVVVALDLLLRVVVERELHGLHQLLQLSGLVAHFHQAVQDLFGLVPFLFGFLFPFVGQFVPLRFQANPSGVVNGVGAVLLVDAGN